MSISSEPPFRPRKRKVPAKPSARASVGMTASEQIDTAGLYRDLSRELAGEVRFDRGSLALYATDSSNYRQVPIGVVVPRTLDDVVATHRICAKYRAPIVNRGGGTSLSGETVNFAVVIDHSKYLRRIDEPDRARRVVNVETGAVNEQVNIKTGQAADLIFGPDPSSHAYCTIGGNLGNNSCGIHSVQSQIFGPGPRTSDNLHAMEIVTYRGDRFWVGNGEEGALSAIINEGGAKGRIYSALRALRDKYADLIRAKYPSVTELPRRVSGFNLDELLPEKGFNVARALVGTESTCATVLQADLLLTPALLERTTVVVEYKDVCEAATHVPEILAWKPIGLEGIDDELFRDESIEHIEVAGLESLPLPGEHGWLLVQFGADDRGEVEDLARRFSDWLVRKMGYAGDRIRLVSGDSAETLWKVREGGLGATAFPPDGQDHWPGWEDSAVPPARVGEYMRDLKGLYKKYGLMGAMYGHLGQGCVHSRISFDLRTSEGVRDYRAFLAEASDLVVSYGGTLSGEHGDGQQRAEFLVKQFGPELLDVMREFKRIWDPDWKMNPDKVIDPYRVDDHLKLGTSYNPPRPETKFTYEEDHGDFAHATLRCVGVGKCREPDTAGVMCPSYAVTREEKHTTRGRARLLFEMLQGDVVRDGWQSKEVHEALDLCLACKGCTADCPVNVDMPTYKAEFLYHHYKSLRRNRPRQAYAFGFIDKWSRLASLIPEVVNFVTQTPGLRDVAKWAAGIDRRRSLPKFAPMTLQSWFRRRGGTTNKTGPKVVLFPDTFNNHLHTDVGVACVEGLEAAGFRVLMPQGHVCCGRPLYDYGFLDVAKRYLERTLAVLRDEVRQGTPVVGMEPSCLAVFRNELKRMMPFDNDAARLRRNAFHWAEFFEKHDVRLPQLAREAIVWGHCHHKATGGIEPEKKLLGERMGMSVQEAKGGCCGLAGSWGFEKGKYDISMQCGELGLLPAVRRANANTLIVADGFSCKTQLEEARLGRVALHTAQVMKMARDQERVGLVPAEREVPARPTPRLPVRIGRTAAMLGIAAALVGLAAISMRRRLRR